MRRWVSPRLTQAAGYPSLTRRCCAWVTLFTALSATVPTARGEEDRNFEALPLQVQYRVLLEPWIRAAMTEIRFLQDDMAVYGLGQSGHWHMQAHDTAFCAFAVLGTDPQTDEARVGMTKAELRRIALAMLRYTLRSHHSGGGVCTDGKSWGHTWISSLGLERMSVGIDALEACLDETLRALYAKVCASEADYLLTRPVTAGLIRNNHPESNQWQGNVTHRAAVLNPGHPHAADWREQASVLLVNSLSTPSDETRSALVDGKPVSARFVGANMFDSRACNHHGYLNVGYMYITQSNLGIYHFACKRRGVRPPEALYHNALEQWRVNKACTFDDGRLARLGGDSRVRYAYGQDYAIPVWLLARDVFGDADAERFERGWLRQVRAEQKANSDGWFMRERLSGLQALSPLYFQRLEGDKACTLAYGAYWRRVFDFDAMPRRSVDAPTRWQDAHHGAWLQRGTRRFASWVWHGAMKACGLCVPSDRSDMAEWQHNLAGQVCGMGAQNVAVPVTWTGYAYEGGFATCGRAEMISKNGIAEGSEVPGLGQIDLAFCALPDDRTTVVIQRAVTRNPCYLLRVRGFSLSVPNDALNGFTRTLQSAAGRRVLRALPDRFEIVSPEGRWLNLDGRLGVVELYGGAPHVARLPERQIPLNIWNSAGPKRGGGYLYCEEIGQNIREGAAYFGARATIFDCAAAVVVADAADTAAIAADRETGAVPLADADLRAVRVRDARGTLWGLLANFSTEAKSLDSEPVSGWLGSGAVPLHAATHQIAPHGIAVWRLAGQGDVTTAGVRP
ncbi:MAG TPA: hypothetical protein PLH01_02250 [Kiritimatiellia bacterium]|nr:hypothetical protein [Kiritimatiellia bacterium]